MGHTTTTIGQGKNQVKPPASALDTDFTVCKLMTRAIIRDRDTTPFVVLAMNDP